MAEARKFTRQQLCDIARREVAMRRKVYPGLVHRGKMRQAEADLEIAGMERIEAYLLVVRDDDELAARVAAKLDGGPSVPGV